MKENPTLFELCFPANTQRDAPNPEITQPRASCGVCAWCQNPIVGLMARSHGICVSCLIEALAALDPSGPRVLAEREAEAERVARCERAGVEPLKS